MSEVADNPPDLKERLSVIPVYTVTNKKNEFVLVTGKVRLPQFLAVVMAKQAQRVRYRTSALPTAWRDASQGSEERRQLGLFFLLESDAHALIAKVLYSAAATSTRAVKDGLLWATSARKAIELWPARCR